MKRLFLLLLLLFGFTVPVLAQQTYYDACPKLEDIMKNRKITHFRHIPAVNDNPNLVVRYNLDGQIMSFGRFKFEYNDDGTYSKICGHKVIYNERGQIEKIGRKKATYNEQGQLVKVGRFDIIYKNNGELDYFGGFLNIYRAIYRMNYDYLNLDIFYKNLLTDKFFNIFKYDVEKYQNYSGLESVIIKKNAYAKDILSTYVNNIKRFSKLYDEYKEKGTLSNNDKDWFMSQVKQTEDWMKTHKVGYKNPYLEHYKDKDITQKTKEEMLEEELYTLRNQIQQLKQEQENNRIKYINGKYVQYSDNGNVYIRE